MKTKTKNYLMSFLILIVYFLGVFRTSFYFNKFFNGTEFLKHSLNFMVGINLIFGIILYVILNKIKISEISKNINKENVKKAVLIGVLAGIVLFVGDKLIDFIFKMFRYIVPNDTLRIKNVINNNKIMFLYMVIIMPIIQELIYRNIIFGKLYDLYEGGFELVRFLTPALLTGFVFFLFNGVYSLYFLVKFAYISVVLSYIYYRTKRIETSILANILYNLIIVILALMMKSSSLL